MNAEAAAAAMVVGAAAMIVEVGARGGRAVTVSKDVGSIPVWVPFTDVAVLAKRVFIKLPLLRLRQTIHSHDIDGSLTQKDPWSNGVNRMASLKISSNVSSSSVECGGGGGGGSCSSSSNGGGGGNGGSDGV